MTFETDRRHKVLISSDWGVGKSTMLLDFSNFAPGHFLSIDYERGQDLYLAPSAAHARREEGLFHVARLVAPSLYELKTVIQRILNPTAPPKSLSVDRKPVDPDALSIPVRNLCRDIAEGRLQISGIGIDTVTRLCELTVAKVFGDLIARKGEAFAEKMSQLTWSQTKDDLSELFYQIIQADLHLIMTAWAKPRFDVETRQSTRELVADTLKNVNAFVDLSLMLEASPRNQPAKGLIYPPQARVTKSRVRRLPAGVLLAEATWEKIFAAHPQFVDEDAHEELTPASATG